MSAVESNFKRVYRIAELEMDCAYWRRLMVWQYANGMYTEAMAAQLQMHSSVDELRAVCKDLSREDIKLIDVFRDLHAET